MPYIPPTSPKNIIQFLQEVRKRLPENWIKSGASYSASVEANNYGHEDIIEYQIYVTPPQSTRNGPIQINRHKSVRAALVELEDALKGFPQLSI